MKEQTLRYLRTGALYVTLAGTALLVGRCVSNGAMESGTTLAPQGAESLFNGTDLTGWNGDPRVWRVENGAIVAQTTAETPIQSNTFLIWEGGTVKDFDLKLSFRLTGGNSGVQYRSTVVEGWTVSGYQADMDAAGEERPGGQHHRPALEHQAHLGAHAGHAVALKQQVVHRLLEQIEIGLVFEPLADRLLVQHAVGLGTGGPHRRPLAGIEDAELDARLVGGQGHGATQGIHFLDQMAFADAADGWVAGHLPQRLDVVREQEGPTAHACGRERGFGAGMAAAYDDDIETGGIKHGDKTAERVRMIRLEDRSWRRLFHVEPECACFTWNTRRMQAIYRYKSG